MRSRLEADYAAHLDNRGVEWEYEPICFAGPAGQWLPDFTYEADGTRFYIEIKPSSIMKPEDILFFLSCDLANNLSRMLCQDYIPGVANTLDRMAVAWLSDPATTLMLVVWMYGYSTPVLTIIGRDGTWRCRESKPSAAAAEILIGRASRRPGFYEARWVGKCRSR